MGEMNLSTTATAANRDTISLDAIVVETGTRGSGIGTRMLQHLKRKLAQEDIGYLTAEVTSKGILRTLIAVFGKPEYIDNNIRELTLAEAMERLPEKGDYDEKRGFVYSAKLFVRIPLKRRSDRR